MQEKINRWLSWLLLLSILLSLALVTLGAILYLLEQGQNPIVYQHFSQLTPTYTAFGPILRGVLVFDPFSLILFGFFILVFSQILRVFMLGCFFLYRSEYLLTGASFFIFIILIDSLLWHK